ncbi:hypothetical protein, partial [Enterobacter bugandensis]|uniref:hypothetical protein n=1 Tax=Enterobacter bugandensis TaxID=881260 RepID=UPI0023606775
DEQFWMPPVDRIPRSVGLPLGETGSCYPPPPPGIHDLSVKSTKEGDYHQQLHRIEIDAFSSYIHQYKNIIQGMEVMKNKFERIKNELNKEKQKKERSSSDYAEMEKVFSKLEKFNALSELMQACTWFYFTNNNEFLYRWCLDVANGFLTFQRQFGAFRHEVATLAHPSNMLCREDDFIFSRVDGLMGLLGHDKYLLEAKRTELDLIAKMNDIIDYLKTCNDPALNKLELYSKSEIAEITNNKNLQHINGFKEREQDTLFGNLQTGRLSRLATYAHDLSTMQNIIREYSKTTRAVYNASENIEMYNR